MLHQSTTPPGKISKETRILNEFDAKIVNEEKLDMIVIARALGERSLHDVIPFGCECDDRACLATIQMSTEEYKSVHRKTRQFVVLPAHVQLDLEEVVATFRNYVIVGKVMPYLPT
jgi:hypothetical protein